MKSSIVIQAGGQSSRMGRDKGLVPLAGRPLIEHVLDRVSGLADELLITTNRPQAYAYLGLRLASDAIPGAGALHGLQTALQAASGQAVLIIACDMPFVNRSLLAHLLALAPQAEVVVPRWQGRYQPLHAVYARLPALAAVSAALQQGQSRMISFYPELAVRPVEAEEIARFDPDGLSFLNINTPEELAQAEARLRGWSDPPL